MDESKNRSPILVVLLSFITCGIYGLYWIYKISEEIQEESRTEETVSPGIEVLLCLVTFGIYTFFWYYKYGKKIYEIQTERNIEPADDNAVIYIILMVFGLGILAMAIMQFSVNKIWSNELKHE